MRAIFGLVGLLMVLAVTGFLVRQQMKAAHAPVPALRVPATAGDDTQSVSNIVVPASGTAAQQSQQLQQQFKQTLDKAMQTRPMPEDNP